MNTQPRITSLLPIVLFLVLLPALASCGKASEEALTSALEPAAAEAASQSLVGTRIVMASTAMFANLERPPVVFDHLRHTESLEETQCTVCHTIKKDDALTYAFVERSRYKTKDDLINAYHTKCGECHDKSAETDTGARALGCGECHVESSEYKTVSWYKPAFEHFHHLEAMGAGCGTCHHVYSEIDNSLKYVKGQETPCGECHKDRDMGATGSLRRVSHTQCIGCHEKRYLAAEIKMDPYDCKNCHKPEVVRKDVAEAMHGPGPYETKPKTVLITYPDSILPPVSFDHEKHVEGKKCSNSCHHFHVRTIISRDLRFLETGDACRQCHVQSDVPPMAGSISRDRTYHDPKLESSCVGCHKKENKGPVTCAECHAQPVMTAEREELEKREDVELPPDVYLIARLANKHKPVEFPHARHAKIVGTCDLCHHYSPEKQKPACNTCHGDSADFQKLAKPGLLSAYHRMCIGCHRDTGIGPVGCAKCHGEWEVQDWLAGLGPSAVPTE
jgi:hypothetical protein